MFDFYILAKGKNNIFGLQSHIKSNLRSESILGKSFVFSFSVSSEIAKAGSQIELWFKFITHCIEDFPQVFSGVFPGHSDLSSATRLVQEGQEESQCQGTQQYHVIDFLRYQPDNSI